MQCNVPTFIGNGTVCGLDTDSDGFPDVKLDCSVEMSSCEQVYSYFIVLWDNTVT